jgi:hypothetical protein
MDVSRIWRDWMFTSRTTSDQGENGQRDERAPLNSKKLNISSYRLAARLFAYRNREKPKNGRCRRPDDPIIDIPPIGHVDFGRVVRSRGQEHLGFGPEQRRWFRLRFERLWDIVSTRWMD